MADKGRYRKVYEQFWSDPDVRALSRDERLIALYCITGPQSNRIGIFLFSLALMVEDLTPTDDAMRPDRDCLTHCFDRVCNRLNWRYDEQVRVLYIPSWFKWNNPDNSKSMHGFLKDLGVLPQTPLIQEFTANEAHLTGRVLDAFREGCAIRYPLGMASQEQEQEQYQEKDPPQTPPLPANGDDSTPQRKPGQPLVTLADITIPRSMDTVEVRDAIDTWLAYKRRRRQGYKTAKQIEMLLSEFSDHCGPDGPRALCTAVKHAIARNYAGFFLPTGSQYGHTQTDRREEAHTRGQRRVFD